jgi:hypothetical protein
MLTRRHMLVTLVTTVCSRVVSANAQQPTPGDTPLPRNFPPTSVGPPAAANGHSSSEVMGSSVFDWRSLPVQKTKVGESRKVCQAPTATLDELECHITTLNPGETPHPPHKHPDEEIVIVKRGAGFGDLSGGQPDAQHQERRRRAGDISRDQVEFSRHVEEEHGQHAGQVRGCA